MPLHQLTKLRKAPNGSPSLHFPSDALHLNRLPANHPCPRSFYLSEPLEHHHIPVISQSDFVPFTLAKHLMRRKRDVALATKYLPGSAITNMEAALHTFVTPLVGIEMAGDYAFRNRHSVLPFGSAEGKQLVRRCVLSATIHLDFEDYDVGHALYSIGKRAVCGVERLPAHFAVPSAAT